VLVTPARPVFLLYELTDKFLDLVAHRLSSLNAFYFESALQLFVDGDLPEDFALGESLVLGLALHGHH
jgi:hypothetical protein